MNIVFNDSIGNRLSVVADLSSQLHLKWNPQTSWLYSHQYPITNYAETSSESTHQHKTHPCICARSQQLNIKKIGVLRDRARAPQPPTNPPIGHHISQQGLAKNDQKYQFRAKFRRFGQKILILTGESKSFGTQMPEKTHRHLVCIVFLSGIGQNGPKLPIFGQKGQKSIFWTKFGLFGPKFLILQEEAKVLVPT